MLVPRSVRLFVLSVLLVLPASAVSSEEQGFLPTSELPAFQLSSSDLSEDRLPQGDSSEGKTVSLKAADGEGKSAECGTNAARVLVDVRRQSFDSPCLGEGGYVTGPVSPLQFPLQAESDALQEWKTLETRNRLRNGDEFVLAKCSSQLAFYHEPKVNARKVKEISNKLDKPLLLFVFSIDGLSKDQFSTEMVQSNQVLSAISQKHTEIQFENHRISSSVFSPNKSFGRLPESELISALKSQQFLTMANIEGCAALHADTVPVDHTAYELYCALQQVTDTGCGHEAIAHEAGFEYIQQFVRQSHTANSFVYSYLTVREPSTVDRLFSEFVHDLFARYEAEHEIAVVFEGAKDSSEAFAGLLATNSLIERFERGLKNVANNGKALTASQDIERTLLMLARYPHFVPVQSFDLISTQVPTIRSESAMHVLPWANTEYTAVDITGDVLDSMVQQVEQYVRTHTQLSLCSELQVEYASIAGKEGPGGEYLLQFRVSNDPRPAFAATFQSSELVTVQRTDSLGLLCASLSRESPADEFLCLC